MLSFFADLKKTGKLIANNIKGLSHLPPGGEIDFSLARELQWLVA